MTAALLLLWAAHVCAAGPADLAALKPGEARGRYKAEALYLDPAGAPKGARFRHERGVSVDVLFFASVPQVSLSFRTPPDTERGESHTLEHLLLGKGDAGRRLNTLMPMRMGDYTAGTYTDITNYQMSSAAGPAEFYELLETFFHALLRPDFSEEEARREVAHFAVAADSGVLKVEEKGTVYNEMLSRMENPDTVTWDRLGRLMYGPEHPLARNQGGEPSEIWKLSPREILDFHAAHYRADAGLSLVAALPPSWSAEEFLGRLDGIFARLEPRASTRAVAALPPFAPQRRREVWIGRFPSEDASSPRSASFVWPPVPAFTREESTRLGLALSLLADGESSYLYRDLVDRQTRKLDTGATGVGSYVDVYPASFAMLAVSGLPAASIETSTLERLRERLLARVRWLHGLPAGSAELAEAAAKARALILSARRSTLKSMDGPPGFGMRSTGASWNRFLDTLALEPGFAKPLAGDAVYDRVLAEMERGENPWSAALARAGLLEPPYVAAVKADPSLLARQRAARSARLRAETERIAREHGLPEQDALAKFQARYDSATVVLEAEARDAARPAFLAAPPLTLDELEWSDARLPSGPRLIRTHVPSTPFIDVALSFDLRGVPARDHELLPLLGAALSETGVVTREGERLDYARVEERLRAEVYGAGARVSAAPLSRRADLVLHGAASSEDEARRVVAWLEDFMLRPALDASARERLVDVTRSRVQSLRGIFQQDEESWVRGAAAAYTYQDQPLYMALSSPFTTLRHLDRLRWRLEEPSPAERAVIASTLTAVAALADAGDRDAVAALLAGASGEMGEYLRWELSHLPGDSWREDLRRLCAELESDLGRSEETIARLRSLARSVLTRAGARVHLNGEPAKTARVARDVDALLARLPAGARAAAAPSRPLVLERLRRRFPGLADPVHVALVNPGGKTAVISVSAPGARYASRGREELLDVLAAGVLGGGGAHALFMRTWAAGLAYSNGLSASPVSGRVSYYADRCPDPAQTLRFAARTAQLARVDDPFYMEYSLAGAFGDYRAAEDFSSRGAALASDLEEGREPETVRGYKRALLRLARDPGARALVDARLRRALGRVLIGVPGSRVSASKEARAFLIAPEDMLAPYESFLRQAGEADRVVRLYPADFWP